MTAIVLAFDGLIADTLELRAESLQIALSAEDVNIERRRLRLSLQGHSFEEAAVALLGTEDPTATDLVALRAQREASARFAYGVSLALNARAYVDAQRTAGAKLVLRADSIRRDVERVLQLTDLEFAFTFIRCADDLPRARGLSTLESSYSAINKRLDSLRIGERRAIEHIAEAADVARRFIGQAEWTEHLEAGLPRH